MDQKKPPNPSTLLFRLVLEGVATQIRPKTRIKALHATTVVQIKGGYSTLAKQGANMHKHRKEITNSKTQKPKRTQ